MRFWLLAIGLQALILALGSGLWGAAFLGVSVLHAPVVNLLLWTGLISLAGLAASAATHYLHRAQALALLLAAIAWGPLSLLIFGNARFSGTTPLLWQAYAFVRFGTIHRAFKQLAVSWAGFEPF